MSEELANSEIIEKTARELVRSLKLPHDFLEKLSADDDWSFVVKLHALVEGAMTHALTAQFMAKADAQSSRMGHFGIAGAEENAEEIFTRLELSNDKTGKLAFSKILLNLNSQDRRFIKTFSELRNRLVHDVRNVNFNFATYFDGLTLQKKRAFVASFGYLDDESPSVLDLYIGRAPGNLRPMIYGGIILLLGVLQLGVDLSRAVSQITKDKVSIAEKLIPTGQSRSNEHATIRLPVSAYARR